MNKFISIIIVFSLLMVTCVWAETKGNAIYLLEKIDKRRDSDHLIGGLFLGGSFLTYLATSNNPTDTTEAIVSVLGVIGLDFLIAPRPKYIEKMQKMETAEEKEAYAYKKLKKIKNGQKIGRIIWGSTILASCIIAFGYGSLDINGLGIGTAISIYYFVVPFSTEKEINNFLKGNKTSKYLNDTDRVNFMPILNSDYIGLSLSKRF